MLGIYWGLRPLELRMVVTNLNVQPGVRFRAKHGWVDEGGVDRWTWVGCLVAGGERLADQFIQQVRVLDSGSAQHLRVHGNWSETWEGVDLVDHRAA